MEYRRCSLVLVRYKPAAYSAVGPADAAVAVALAVAAGSVAWLVVAGPILVAALLVVAQSLGSLLPPSAGFPLLGYGMFARYARAIRA